LTVLAASLVLTSCQSLPPSPDINLYSMDYPRAQALCSNSKGVKCDKVFIAATDKFYMLSPKDWEKLQNYIDKLICVARGGCKTSYSLAMTEPPRAPLMGAKFIDYSQDVIKVKTQLQKIDKTLKTQRLEAEAKK
jgi:hypothetical protein